jgi:ubiquinone/menaquinone biosynthesis C-methylase UbiE
VSAPDLAAIAARWTANADRYASWGDIAHGHPRYRAAWIAALADLVGHPRRDGTPPARIADVGTGTGEVALLLADMGHHVQAFDIATGMLEHARAKPAPPGGSVAFAVGNAYELPLPPASVDVVINRMVFWTLHDPPGALHEWQRILAPGGRIVVIDGLHFAAGRSPAQRIRRARTRMFWALEARIAGRRHRGSTATAGSRNDHTDNGPPPGTTWTGAEDAHRQFSDAGLRPTSFTWLDAVQRAQRATAPLRWRLAGLLPRFFAITWEAP